MGVLPDQVVVGRGAFAAYAGVGAVVVVLYPCVLLDLVVAELGAGVVGEVYVAACPAALVIAAAFLPRSSSALTMLLERAAAVKQKMA